MLLNNTLVFSTKKHCSKVALTVAQDGYARYLSISEKAGFPIESEHLCLLKKHSRFSTECKKILDDMVYQAVMKQSNRITTNDILRCVYVAIEESEAVKNLLRENMIDKTSAEQSELYFLKRHLGRCVIRGYMPNIYEVNLLYKRDITKYGSPHGPMFSDLLAKHADQAEIVSTSKKRASKEKIHDELNTAHEQFKLK